MSMPEIAYLAKSLSGKLVDFGDCADTEYQRKDIADARVATAYEAAAMVAGEAWTWPDADVSAVPCQEAIRALATKAQRDALERVRTEEREKVLVIIGRMRADYLESEEIAETNGFALMCAGAAHALKRVEAAIREGGE